MLQGPIRGRVRGSPVFLDRAAVPWVFGWTFQFRAAGAGLGGRGRGAAGGRGQVEVEPSRRAGACAVRRPRAEERKELCVSTPGLEEHGAGSCL